MRPFFLLSLFCLPVALFAQPYTTKYIPIDERSPYDPKANFHTWNLKGKILPFPIGNGGGISGMLGIEYGFAQNQSIGVDGYILLQEDSHDNISDTAGVEHSTAQTYHSSERALFLNYRYYFNFARLRRHGFIPYALVFYRYCKLGQHFDPHYPLTSFLNNYETQNSVGLMIGSSYQFRATPRLGLDVNLGIFEKQKDITTNYLQNRLISTAHTHPFGPGFRISVNLVYWFYFKAFTPPRNSTSRPAQ